MVSKSFVIKSCWFFILLIRPSVWGFQYAGYQSDSEAPHRFPRNTSVPTYSQWSSWSPCTGSCGIGISTRTRICQKRPSSSGYNGLTCLGESSEHKICNLEPCARPSEDPRAAQCSKYNNRLVAGQQAKVWTPTNDGSNPCELRCQSSGVISSFGKVTDGTPCGGGICLDGRCLRVGCDDKLGSGTELDKCGVCGGRNATCVHYRDIFRGQLAFSPSQESRSEYRDVAIIPVGARNLEIKQPVGENILVIRDRITSVLYHGRERTVPNEKRVSGAIFTYSLEDGNKTEVLRTSGSITEQLYILVLIRTRNPGISYEYWLPLEQSRPFGFQLHPPPNYIHTTVPPSRTTSATPPPQYSPTYKPYPIQVPTKEPFRYRKPVYSQKTTTSKSGLMYGPKRKGYAKPLFDEPIETPVATTEEDNNVEVVFRKGNALYLYNPNYKTPKPLYNYYERYKNLSTYYTPPENIYRKLDVLPQQQTQRDSTNVDERENSPSDAANPEDEKFWKFKNLTKYDLDPNPKWKYTIDGKNENVDKWKELTTPVAIEVLSLPDVKNYTKTRRGKRRGLKHKGDSKAQNEGFCPQCQRIRDQTTHFCISDFVIRAIVVNYDFIHGETRYELEVLQSFKNNFALLPKEYVWAPDTCRCPKLRIGKEYVIMGRSDAGYRKNESRLLVDKDSFVRNFNAKIVRRLLKLRKDYVKKCKSRIT